MAAFFVKRTLNANQIFACSRSSLLPITVQCCAYGGGEMVNGGPIVKQLEDKVSRGELMSDEHQRKVVDELERIYRQVENYEPPLRTGLFSKWIIMGKGNKKKKKTPKGLYIYGAVGGGKTMLMDLFYNCCQVSQYDSQIESHLQSQ